MVQEGEVIWAWDFQDLLQPREARGDAQANHRFCLHDSVYGKSFTSQSGRMHRTLDVLWDAITMLSWELRMAIRSQI